MSETELIFECKKYNPAAQKVVYKNYYATFLLISYRYTGNREESKDIVHDAFLKIFTGIAAFKADGSFEGWMKRIVINDTLTHIKKKSKNKFESISDDNDSFAEFRDEYYGEEEDSDKPYSQEKLLAAIHSLPETLRVVFNMACIEDYSHKEIAEILNISEENSRARLMKARLKLKKILEVKSTYHGR